MMTEHDTTTNTLQRLFRSLCASRAPTSNALDADTLLAAACGKLTPTQRDAVAKTLGCSPAQAATVLFLRDLEPDSARLAAAGAVRGSGHTRRARTVVAHSHSHRRRQHTGLRWLGAGVAAIMVCALGVWGWQQAQTPPLSAPSVASQPAPVTLEEDRIFSARMDDALAARQSMPDPAQNDRIFRAGFKRQG